MRSSSLQLLHDVLPLFETSPPTTCSPRYYPPPTCTPWYPSLPPPLHKRPSAPELTECKIDVYIMDVHSWVTLSQKFRNPSKQAHSRIIYTFSMLAGSAIYNFEMVRQNGTKVTGIIKEREEARRELDAALVAGHTAALGEEQTKDIFSIELGNIGPNETITINLSYISPLLDDEAKNQLRFSLPRTYMQRCDTTPTTNTKSELRHDNIPFTMKIVIQQAGRIKRIKSHSGYDIDYSHGRPGNLSESYGPHENFTTLTMRRNSGSTGPSRDVIVIIEAEGLDSPRAFIEPHPSPDFRTTAIGLTLVPSFPPMESPLGMEYIMLVSRSESIGGVNMKMMQSVLKVLIKGLPRRNSFINVFSYGAKIDSLWPQCKPYDEPNVDSAIRYIDSMKADYSTADTANALDAVFSSLPSQLTRPVSVFLVMGDRAHNLKECMDKTEKAIRDRSTTNTFMRLFTIGLGSGVSTATCDGIARAGNGAAVYIISPDEPYLGKCVRLVRAARQSPVTDIVVSWQDSWQDNMGFRAAPENPYAFEPTDLFQEDYEFSDEDTGPDGRMEQAPLTLPSFFPSTRMQIYAFLPKEDFVRTRPIVITGKVPSLGNRPVRIAVPVRNLLSPPGASIMHKITARALITEFEDGKYPGDAAELKENIIRLGLKHNLTSRHTSFVAVDSGRPSSSATTWNGAMAMPISTQERPQSTRPPNDYNRAPKPTPLILHAPLSASALHAQPDSPPLSKNLPPLNNVFNSRGEPTQIPPQQEFLDELGGHPFAPCTASSGIGNEEPDYLEWPTEPRHGRFDDEEPDCLECEEEPFIIPIASLPPSPSSLRSLSPPASINCAESSDVSEARSHATSLVEEGRNDDDEAVTISEIVTKLAQYQSFDGAFAKASWVFKLFEPRGGDTAKPFFSRYNLNDTVAAALLAWAWLDTFCSDEGEDIKAKTDLWIRENAKGIDVGTVQRELLREVAFDTI